MITRMRIRGLMVEFDQDVDGRYIAEIVEFPGAMSYGCTPLDAMVGAFHVLSDAMGRGNGPGRPHDVLWDQTTVFERRRKGSRADMVAILAGLIDPLIHIRVRRACARAMRELIAESMDLDSETTSAKMLWEFSKKRECNFLTWTPMVIALACSSD